MENNKSRERKEMFGKIGRGTASVVKYTVLIIFALLILLPLLWVVMSSLKTTEEIKLNAFGIPTRLHFQNYADAWSRANMGTYFLNSILLTGGGLLLLVILAVPCSYTLSRFKFRGATAISIFFMAGLFININYIVLPLHIMLFNFGKAIGIGTGITNNYFTVIILYASTSLSFSIYLMSSYFKALSPSFEEAAKIDGCGYFKTFLYICAPLATPSILTVILFNFLSFWNEYILAQTFLSMEKATLPMGLLRIMRVDKAASELGRMYAGLMIVMIPVLIVYACVQGQLTKGITMGGVKG